MGWLALGHIINSSVSIPYAICFHTRTPYYGIFLLLAPPPLTSPPPTLGTHLRGSPLCLPVPNTLNASYVRLPPFRLHVPGPALLLLTKPYAYWNSSVVFPPSPPLHLLTPAVSKGCEILFRRVINSQLTIFITNTARQATSPVKHAKLRKSPLTTT